MGISDGANRDQVVGTGIEAMDGTRYGGLLRDLAEEGYVTPPQAGPGAPPPSAPVAPLETVLAELADDRGER